MQSYNGKFNYNNEVIIDSRKQMQTKTSFNDTISADTNTGQNHSIDVTMPLLKNHRRRLVTIITSRLLFAEPCEVDENRF